MGISVDTVNLRFNVKPNYDQQQLQQLQEDLKNGQQELENTRRAMDKLAKNGLNAMTKEQRAEYDKLSHTLTETARKVHENEKRMQSWTRSADISKLSIKQLGQRAKDLSAVLNNLSPDTDEFVEYKKELDAVKDRIKELKTSAEDVSTSLGKFSSDGFLGKLTKGVNMGQLKTMMSANFLTGAITTAVETIGEYAGRALNRVKELVSESVQAARAAQGITHAFESIDKPDLLKNLRQSTHGTVSDLELMKAAVQAKDFRLPLDQLGKYLEFAQLKAQQTGQSVDYMTNSIVTGLGRKSVMILDNLGLSASEIKEEMEKTGDMATAVGNIIDKQLSQAGEHFETAAEREARATTDVTNAQLKLGQQMQKTFGIGNTSFSEMQAKAETFVLNGLTKLIVYCQNLYDRLASVRVIVEGVKIVFDTLFKVCEGGFYGILDTIRIVGRALMDVGGLIESVFKALVNRDFSYVTRSWETLTSNLDRGFTRFATHMKGVGTQWGKNVIDSMNAITGNAKVKLPDVPSPGRPAPVAPDDTKPDPKKSPTPKSTDNGTDEFQKALAEREQAYKEYGNSLKEMLLGQLLTEDEYQQEQLMAEKKFLADKIDLLMQYGKDASQTQGEFLDLMIRESNDKYKQSQKQLKDDLAAEDANHAAQIKQLMEQQLSGELGSQQRYNELKLQADIDYYKRKLEIMKAAGADTAAVEQQLLQLQLQQRQQSEQQQTQSTDEETEKRKKIWQKAFDAVNGLMQSASGLFSALQQREISAVDKKYKSRIDAAKKAGKDTTKLEEQMEAEKAEIQKKYAQKQFKLQVLQIIAATAQSIANVWKEWAWNPAIAAAFSAAAAAQGAIQLATAKAQADQAAGLYEGGFSEGYTAKGDPHKQAGVIPVHQNEFVANHHAVANPEIRPLLDVIDRHQKIGDIRMLNSTRMLEEAYGGGRYRGGYTRGGAADDSQEFSDPSLFIGPNGEVVRLLRAIESNTADSLTVRELRREIRQQERLEQNASR